MTSVSMNLHHMNSEAHYLDGKLSAMTPNSQQSRSQRSPLGPFTEPLLPLCRQLTNLFLHCSASTSTTLRGQLADTNPGHAIAAYPKLTLSRPTPPDPLPGIQVPAQSFKPCCPPDSKPPCLQGLIDGLPNSQDLWSSVLAPLLSPHHSLKVLPFLLRRASRRILLALS